MKKHTYVVSVPIAGAIHIQVKAKSESEARHLAWERINDDGPDAGDVEWEFFDALTEGNVLHAPLNEVEVSQYESSDDE